MLMFECTKCKTSLDESMFYKQPKKINGCHSQCKKCMDAYQKTSKGKYAQSKYRQTEKCKTIFREYSKTLNYKNAQRKYQQSTKGKETRKRFANSPKGIGYSRRYSNRYRIDNPDKIKAYDMKKKTIDPKGYRALKVTMGIKHRSKKKGIPFDMTKQNLIDMQNESDTCPCCYEPFDFNFTGPHDPHSPSVDRLIPELGYVPGNIKMICYACNRRKNTSSIKQLEQIIRYMRKYQELIV